MTKTDGADEVPQIRDLEPADQLGLILYRLDVGRRRGATAPSPAQLQHAWTAALEHVLTCDCPAAPARHPAHRWPTPRRVISQVGRVLIGLAIWRDVSPEVAHTANELWGVQVDAARAARVQP